MQRSLGTSGVRAGTLTIPTMVKKVAFCLDSGYHINFKKNMSDPFEPYMNPEGSRTGRTHYNNSISPRSRSFAVPLRTNHIMMSAYAAISMECYNLPMFNNEFLK